MTAPEPVHHLALFAASPTPMLLVDHEAGVIVEANPAAARFYGYSMRAMQGMPVTTLSPEAPLRLRQVALNATGALSFVVDHRLASGKVQRVAIGSSLVAVDDKPLVYSVIRPAAEVASEREIADLRESERRYRDLVEHLGAGVVLFDPDGNPTWVNETMASMLGHTRDELLALGNTVVAGPTSSGWSPRTLEALTEQASLRYDLVFRHRDGHHLTGEVRARRIHEGAIEAVIHDVTAQRAAAAARKALESERDRLALALEQSSDVVILTDLRGMTTYVNRAFERMYGMPRTDVIGARATRWLVRLSDSDPATRIFATLRTTGHWHGDVRQRRRDGTRFTASAHIALVRDPGGEPIGYLGIARDVTHERAVAERMAESAKVDAVGQLAGGVAHAFNNLLTGVLGYAQLAASAPSGDPALAEDLREIMEAAHRAQALTRQLLAFGRRSPHKPRVLDPVGAVAALEPGLRQLAGSAVTLELEEGPGTGLIRVDPTLLEHALVGLVENAREAMPSGGRIRIEIGAPAADDDAPPGRWAAIRVQDSGPGMDGPTRARALEPFFSTKQVAGAGLGLPMVNGFAIRSGGHLRVRSVPGAGTEVTLLMPLVTAESAAEVAAPVPGSAADQSEGHAARHAARHAADAGSAGPTVIADPSSGGQPATVLVVDDEAVLRAIAERVMVGAGHRVLLAASGEEALEVAARAGRIDLLFTDIVMPGMHGIDLAAALRATRPDLRVLVTSGFTPDDIDRRGVGLAGTPFLPKPYTPAELREAVATELRRDAETGPGKG